MQKIKKIGIFSLAKILTIIMGFIGLICGILYSVGGFIYEALRGMLNPGTALAFFALLGMPLLFAAAGVSWMLACLWQRDQFHGNN